MKMQMEIEIEMDIFNAGKLFKVDRLISETLINGIRFKIFKLVPTGQ
jgi:hypothetical protein